MWNPFKKKFKTKLPFKCPDSVRLASNGFAELHSTYCAVWETMSFVIERKPAIPGKINEYKITIEPIVLLNL